MCAWLIGYQPRYVDVWDRKLSQFGLDLYEENTFALAFGGAFLGCLVALCKGNGQTIPRWTCKLRSILESVAVGEYGLHVAVWMCHIAVLLDRPDDFEAAQDYIEATGGIPAIHLLNPPSHCAVEVDIREEYFKGAPSKRLSFLEFSMAAKKIHSNKDIDRSVIAFRLINHECYVFDWAEDILAALWVENKTHPE